MALKSRIEEDDAKQRQGEADKEVKRVKAQEADKKRKIEKEATTIKEHEERIARGETVEPHRMKCVPRPKKDREASC
ncbi:MAG TPA: hypothetical protein VM260_14720 [Pirellula sp.]|nr:hypothetical protein [Pirellula sp.]